MPKPTSNLPKNRRWSAISALCTAALAVEAFGVFLYLDGRYEKEGIVATAVACLLLHIFTILGIAFARTAKRKIISYLFLVIVIAHWVALVVAVATLIDSLSHSGGHLI